MNFLFTTAIVLLLCVISSKVLYRFGIPTLIIFLAIGMLMGSDGPGGIYLKDPLIAQNISNLALIFIIFSGGFGTRWATAKSVALAAGILSTIGVAITAIVIGVFAHFVLGYSWLHGMLLGSIVSSTDAAAVFSILRSRKLSLKNGLASMLEMESGSNDPMAFMLTTVFLGLLMNDTKNIILFFTLQIIIGTFIGIIIGKVGVWLINHINLDIHGLYSVVVMATVLLSFSCADMLHGNGFLSVYLSGLIMGNSRIVHKVSLVRYFDGISWLMQILLFFTLGLLVFPTELIKVFLPGLGIAAFIILIARPLAVILTLKVFKRSMKEIILISWVGFRGAASIVFATYPLTQGFPMADEIFNMVFFIGLLSVLIQGTLFIPISKKLDLVEDEGNIHKTFNDYTEDIYADLLEISILEDSPFAGKSIMKLNIPKEVIFVLIKRNNRMITPQGTTVIKAGDTILMAGDSKFLMQVEEMASGEESS